MEPIRRPNRLRDLLYGLLAAAMAALFLANMAGGVWLVFFQGRLTAVFGLLTSELFAFWIGVGAWRRTRWGCPPPLETGLWYQNDG